MIPKTKGLLPKWCDGAKGRARHSARADARSGSLDIEALFHVRGARGATRPTSKFACGSVTSGLIAMAFCLVPMFFSFGAPLDWKDQNGYRIAPLRVPSGSPPGFLLLTNAEMGIVFTNTLSYDRAMSNHNLMNGAGVAAGDFDGDGWSDLYFCNLQGSNALYKNLGNWKFQNVTGSAGVAATNQASTGATFADVNGDGRLDLLVTACGGPNALFINLGEGRFTNMTVAAGLVSRAGSTTMTLADIDRDGDLDLYVANYGETSILRTGGAVSIKTVNGQTVVTGRYANRVKIVNGIMYELGEPDVLYLNDGKGKFSPVSWTGGNFLDEEGKPLGGAPWDMGLSAMFYDFNQDGAPDLYVCNDFQTPDRFWVNNGKGIFHAIDPPALRQTSSFSMSADFADVDRDGFIDLFVADMLSRSHVLRMTQMVTTNAPVTQVGNFVERPQVRRNMFFHGRADGTFEEIANFAGLNASEWTWCGAFMDVDLDGYEDLLIANGHAYDTQDLDAMEMIRKLGKQSSSDARNNLKKYPALRTPNLLFRNRGDLTFVETGKAWGFESPQVSHGIAQADLDNDGDLDLAINCLNEPPLLYRNQTSAPRIAVRVRGQEGNTHGIGVKLKLLGGRIIQSQEMICGGRYLSGDEALRVFAANSPNNHHTLEITWPDGLQSRITNLPGNMIYEVSEKMIPKSASEKRTATRTPYFRDLSDRLQHRHHDEAFDDFIRQPGLPRSFTQRGPGVGWIDLNGDHREELVIGSGRGGKLALFENSGDGSFRKIEGPAAGSNRDDTGMAGWTGRAGEKTVLIGSSSYEDGATNLPAIISISLTNHQLVAQAGPVGWDSAAGPLAVADIDGDEDLDLFVGGQIIPGRYPTPANSKIFRNENGRLVPDTQHGKLLSSMGTVNATLFTDVNQDGWPDLVVAIEWGPIRVFLNKKGSLEEATGMLQLKSSTGWWSSLATGDFNEDGRLDLIAGNWGMNSGYQASKEEPLVLYYGDLDQNGTFDLLEGYSDAGKEWPRRELNPMRLAFPFLAGKTLTHKSYGTLSLNDLFGNKLQAGKKLEAVTLDSTLFLNLPEGFKAIPLPREAQWAPVFGMNVSDFNGDGHEDVFLAQNFSGTDSQTTHPNAGRGLLLEGDGKGNLLPVSGNRSGIIVYGDQRGSATADFDQDGRVDLVVAQNSGETKLYQNVGATPGVRIRLEGPPLNPSAIGAVLKWNRPGKNLVTRILQGGSGYWSQDSPIQIFPRSDGPATLKVLWPGGRETQTLIPPGTASAVVNNQGQLSGK